MRGGIGAFADRRARIGRQSPSAQIADDELVCQRNSEFVPLRIHGSDPAALGFQTVDHRATDEAAGAVYQNMFHLFSLRGLANLAHVDAISSSLSTMAS
jgi:hypothetical protein